MTRRSSSPVHQVLERRHIVLKANQVVPQGLLQPFVFLDGPLVQYVLRFNVIEIDPLVRHGLDRFGWTELQLGAEALMLLVAIRSH